MNSRLIFKLLGINLVVIGFVMAVVWLAIDTLAAGYFVTLMEKYHISPEPAHEMFVSAVHRYLIWACLAAVVLAALLSFVMLRRALAPLTRMTITTKEIAAGDFSSRVPAGSKDEVGQLARAFNRMAASLEKIEKLRRTLMIDVAHELRTPLTNIRGYLEALEDKVVPPSPQTFELLRDESLRLAELVEDVLQLARADAAQGKLTLEPLDLEQEVEKALTPLAHAFKQKGITVTIENHQPITVTADAGKMGRILRSLADNALQYTPEGGHLTVQFSKPDDRSKVTFINNTDGLVAEDLPYLFERFYRGEKSRSRLHGGAGIGLAIVKELVTAHGGATGAALADNHFKIWFSLPVQ